MQNQEEEITILKKNHDVLNQIKTYYYKEIQDYKNYELSKTNIKDLRQKLTLEKKEGFTHKLRTISLYTQEKDHLLKLYISKLYLENFPKNS